MTIISANAVALATSILIKPQESCKLHAYQDENGIWTIGWGDTGPTVVRGLTWTQAQADRALSVRVAGFAADVARLVTVSLTDHQAACLIDFAYNCGEGNLEASTLLADIDADNFADVPHQLSRWIHDEGGDVLTDLVNRRNAEIAVWNTPDKVPQTV